MTEVKKECVACNDKFRWNDEVILVNDELYHKDCVKIFPMGYFVMLDGEPLGESENEDGTLACEYISELLNED